MSRQVLSTLAALFAVATAGLVQAQESCDTELRARCVWATEGLGDALGGLMHLHDRRLVRAADDALNRHALAHGWFGWIGMPDMVPHAAQVACPGDALAQISVLGQQMDRGESDGIFLLARVAKVLERNGRYDDARAVLLAQLASPRSPRVWDGAPAMMHEHLGLLELERGNWAAALDYFESMPPSGLRCGNAAMGELAENQWRKALCLRALARWDELAILTAECLGDDWRFDACLLEPLIDAELALGRANSADEVVARIKSRAHARRHESLDIARRHWEILRMNESDRSRRLPELAREGRHADAVFTALVEGGPAFVESWTWMLGSSGDCEEQVGFAYVLAKLGSPCVQRALLGLPAELFEQRRALQYANDEWSRGHERWRALTER